MNAIETHNLTKVYNTFTAVNSLNLEIPDKFRLTIENQQKKNLNKIEYDE